MHIAPPRCKRTTTTKTEQTCTKMSRMEKKERGRLVENLVCRLPIRLHNLDSNIKLIKLHIKSNNNNNDVNNKVHANMWHTKK